MQNKDCLTPTETIDAYKTLSGKDFNHTFRINRGDFRITLPESIGRGSCRSLFARGCLQMSDFDLQFNRDIEANGEFMMPRTELVFCLGQGIEWGTSLKGEDFEIRTGESALLHGGGRSENCVYHSDAEYRFLSIDMSPDHFVRLIGNKEPGRIASDGLLFSRNSITPEMTLILKQIADCSYGSGMRELYLEGKMLELLAVYLNESVHGGQQTERSVKLSKEDMRSLELAKEILQRDYLHPPTLAGLSRMICLNEFKLKKGFKEMYGYTVHAYAIEQRMQSARRLLEKGDISVSQAAASVGYGNVSHFAAAFRKRFGVSPGAFASGGRRTSVQQAAAVVNSLFGQE